MPWQSKDVEAHNKGLSDKEKAVWVRVANGALTKCEKDGGKDCEASAIKQANAVVGKMKESAATGLDETAGTLSDRLASLVEAGRVLSAKHEGIIRHARDGLDTVLAALPAKEDGTVEESLSEADRSFSDTERLLRASIPELQPSSPEKYDGGWLCDVFEGFCIYQGRRNGALGRGEAYYRRSYAIDSAGKVTLGSPEQVTRRTVYDVVPKELGEAAGTEDDGLVTLVESATFASGDMQLLEAATPAVEVKPLLKLIGVGWGTKGFYGAEVLKRDGPIAFPAGTKNYWNHMTESEAAERPEGNADHLASVTTEPARFLEGAAAPDGPGLYARAKVFSDYAQKVKEKGPYIGTSIRARGDLKEGEAEGRKGLIITRIAPNRFNSADYVTLAGAGGKVLLTESARPPAGPQPQERDMSMNGAPGGAATNTGGEVLSEAALLAKVTGLRTEKETLTTKLQESEANRGTLLVENQKLQQDLATIRAQGLVRKKCRDASVPDHLEERLAGSLPDQLKMKNGTLDEEAFGPLIEKAIREEMAYYASLTGSGRVNGMGGASGGNAPTLEEAQKRLQEAYSMSGVDPIAARSAVLGRGF